ncbi:MAG TPA: MBL fold metallo-hydrolase [Candidatus Paceibacterota bacterium]|nr:MBL fold metallo-hydrolase [Candidatus Paceibacterota bacterium]
MEKEQTTLIEPKEVPAAKRNFSIMFSGGVGSVTGANFLLEDKDTGKRYAIDCGLQQGGKMCDDQNRQPFAYDPGSVDVLFITHAHLDHIGRIPKFVHEGFRGVIYSTPPTKEMADTSLRDSLNVLEKEAKQDDLPPLYAEADIDKAVSLWQTVGYHKPIELDGLVAVFRDAGHILGSAMVEFMTKDGKKILFTGDLGNSPAPLLRPTETVTDADYIVMESVYGDRNHEDRSERRDKLEDIIEETLRQNGTLVIPAFSIERTQELLYEIENMMEQSRIPLVPVFLDSPLGIKMTEIYRNYKEYFNKEVGEINRRGDGILNFPQLQVTLSTEESKAILHANPRKIVIAGSGMSMGGRIVHHEKNYLSGPNNTLLLIGYQAPGSLGRMLQDGAKEVRILGQDVAVNARIAMISGYSAHKDHDGLMEFVRTTADRVKRVYVVMGEPKSSLFLAQRLRDYLGIDAVVPSQGQSADISL